MASSGFSPCVSASGISGKVTRKTFNLSTIEKRPFCRSSSKRDAKTMKDAAIDPAGSIHVGGNRHSRRGSTSSQPHGDNDGADRAAKGRGKRALGPFAPSSVSSGGDPGAATGKQGECAAAPTERSDLVGCGICQRGSHHREFSPVRPSFSGQQRSAGDRRAGRQQSAGDVSDCWRASLPWEDAESSRDAWPVAS